MKKIPDDAAVTAAVADDLPVGVWVARAPGGEFVYANRRFAEIMGIGGRADVAVGEYAAPYGIHGLDGELYPEHKMPFVRALVEKTVVTCDDIVIHRHDGQHVNIRAFARPMFDADNEITHVVIAFIDITREVEAERQRKESEARLHHAERMEAVGKLAGGIAHDFNNLLTVVRSLSSSLAAGESDPGRRDALRLIEQVGDRAMQLTHGLLGFAGRGKSVSEAVSINRMVQMMSALIRRTLDPRIEVALELGAARGEVVGDLSQLEQVFMNLVMNARDAMPDGGKLILRTRDVTLTESEAPPLKAGPHVLFEVEDSGTGIPPEIRARVFEPYFTTKTGGAARGNGLGLATVYGIVESHRGLIRIASAQPHGTIMRMWFPATSHPTATATATAHTPARAGESSEVRGGSGTVLLVEDEKLVRVATVRVLKQLGYRVLACGDGDEAIDLYRERKSEIAAVMLDMLMPRMSGHETFLALRDLDPGVAVLLTTGLAHDQEVKEMLELGVRDFIAKPYEVGALSRALAKVIGAPASPS